MLPIIVRVKLIADPLIHAAPSRWSTTACDRVIRIGDGIRTVAGDLSGQIEANIDCPRCLQTLSVWARTDREA